MCTCAHRYYERNKVYPTRNRCEINHAAVGILQRFYNSFTSIYAVKLLPPAASNF